MRQILKILWFLSGIEIVIFGVWMMRAGGGKLFFDQSEARRKWPLSEVLIRDSIYISLLFGGLVYLRRAHVPPPLVAPPWRSAHL